jgi:probable HAF family extracellular repeat protein
MLNHVKLLVLSVVCFSFLSMCASAEPSYTLVDLGLQSSDRSEALKINDKGLVVGTFRLNDADYYFLWDERKGVRQIDLPNSASIVAFNNRGQIAGNYNDDHGHRRGYVWDECCGFFDIGTLGGKFTHVFDMNDYGQIVGESECLSTSLVDGSNESHAFIWTHGKIFSLGALTGDLGMIGDKSMATGINNKGQIVGISNYLISYKGKFIRSQYRSFLWSCGAMEGIDLDIGPQFAATAPYTTNSGMAIFNNNKMGWFAVDLSTRKIIEIPLANNTSRRPKITKKGDLVLGNDIVLIKTDGKGDHSWEGNFYKYVGLSTSFENLDQWIPNSFNGNDFNNHRWFVGQSTNIYRENHASLLKPINE